ncbi:MAG: NUDIX hydrolase [Polyangiaceae bacterium]|nr:NUDIX hydrolase [Polyangiaceae bacterium]
MRHDDVAVLLIRRKKDPFRGLWALPGGFVNENEALERAAARELHEETGLSGVRLEQLGAFGEPGRDPRGHTVTIAWITYLVAEVSAVAGDDAEEAAFHPLRSLGIEKVPAPGELPSRARKGSPVVRLAFDHDKIITAAYRRLCRTLDDPRRDVGFDLMPPRFTLAEIRRTYEVVFDRPFTAQKIRKQLIDRGLIVAATHKPATKPSAQLYRWNRH